jgi:hypothetical protein
VLSHFPCATAGSTQVRPDDPPANPPGAKRTAPGGHHFDLSTMATVYAGEDYTTATGPRVEGDPLILALMRMPAGTGAEAHCASNEQRIHVIEGYSAPPWVTHNSVKATPEADGVFFTAKDSSHGLQGTKAL